MLAFQIAIKELVHKFSFTFLFTTSLAVGLFGLTTLDSLKVSIRDSLNHRSKGFLAADLSVGARRYLKDDERKIIDKTLPKGATIMSLRESMTMVASVVSVGAKSRVNNSRLTELRVIEPPYPYYGEIELQRQGVISSGTKSDLFSGPNVWIYPELQLQLGIKTGDRLKIGTKEFVVTDTILRDSAGAGSDVSFAPPVYISSESFNTTGLEGDGMSGYHSLLVRLPPGYDNEGLAKELHTLLTDPAIHVETPKDSSEQIGRVLRYLSDYLNLAALVALLLSSIGQFYLLRNYFSSRFVDMAIFKSLGLKNSQLGAIYFWQMLLLSLLSVVPTLAITAWGLPKLTAPLHDLIKIDLSLSLPASTVWLVTIVGIYQSLSLAIPYFEFVRQSNVRSLLQVTAPDATTTNFYRVKTLVLFSPSALGFIILTFSLSHSFKVGGLFLVSLIFGAAILAALAIFCLRFLQKRNWQTTSRLAVLHLSRNRAATLSAFLALSLGILLSNLIPQIETGIKQEVSSPPGIEQPSLFLFDIQDEQLVPVMKSLGEMNTTVMEAAPMVRARLTSVNDKPFSKPSREDNWSRDKENENRSRNRGYNLSFRDKITESESISSGVPFNKSGEPQISLEKRFADRIGVKIGDQMTFDVQGVDVSGRVVNLRKVRWTSFQPNFFIQFNSGPLDNAPKTHLITLPQMDLEHKTAVQRKIVQEFSNIAILDVSRVIERVLTILSQLGLALRIMAAFTMLVGLSILFFVTYQQISDRKREANLFKVLGAPENFIRRIFLTEIFILIAMAIIAGTALSYLIGFFLSYFIFEDLYQPNFSSPFYIATTVLFFGFAITIVILRSVLRDRPRQLLQS